MELAAILTLVFAIGAALVFWLLASAAFLLWGARRMHIARLSFAGALGAILAGGMGSAMLAPLLGVIPWAGIVLSLVAGPGITAGVVVVMGKTPFGQACLSPRD